MKKNHVKLLHGLILFIYHGWNLFWALVFTGLLFSTQNNNLKFGYMLLFALLFEVSKTLKHMYYTGFYWRHFPKSNLDK